MSINLTDKPPKKLHPDRIKISINVRIAEDPERINFFREILENGGKLDPILICNGVEMVDGRNRLSAHILAGKTVIECIDLGILTKTEMYFYALEANSKGAKQASSADIQLVVIQLIGLDVPKEEIIAKIADHTGIGKYAIKIHHDALRALKKQDVREAAKEVRSSKLTVEAAAAKYKVPKNSIVIELGGGKKATKQGHEYVVDMKKSLKAKSKSYMSQVMGLVEKKITDLFLDGKINKKQLFELVGYNEGRTAIFVEHSKNTCNRLRNLADAKEK